MKNEMHVSMKGRVKHFLLDVSDHLDRFLDIDSKIEPPKRLYNQYGTGSYYDTSLEFFKILLDHANLSRSSNILEVGCGIGRMATPLQYFLSSEGSYDGFDIMPDGIEYCKKHKVSDSGNFRYHHVPVHNSLYNPGGSVQPADFDFPFPESSFDIVLSTSVMTHLLPNAATQYVNETARVLKSGGVAVHTFFVIDDFARRRIAEGNEAIGFKHDRGNYFLQNEKFPEQAVAMDESLVSAMFAEAGLTPDIKAGAWSGNDNPLTFQNVVIGRKP